MTRPLAIAIDGPGSAGKGTVARRVAQALGYRYVDTGALYRSVAWLSRRAGVGREDGPSIAALARAARFDSRWDGEILRLLVDGEDLTSAIRDEEVGRLASDVSRHPEVREALLGILRRLGAEGAVVMDGRDIGTVVLPEAELKVFLDADLDERARRRHEELIRRGEARSFAEVRDGLRLRDEQDRNREVAPLRRAEDAVRLDTTDLTLRAAVERVLALAHQRLSADDAIEDDVTG